MIKKQLYAAPSIEVLELRLEGVIAGSLDVQFNNSLGDSEEEM